MVKKLARYKAVLLCFVLLAAIVTTAWLIITQMVSKEIRLIIDGTVSACETKSYTVEELLEEKDIHLVKEDSITPAVEKTLTDGAKVEIVHAVPFTLQADGTTRKLKALPKTIKDALNYHGVKVGQADEVIPALSQPLKAGDEIVIHRITTGEEVIFEDLDFETKVQGTNELPAGTTKTIKKGKKGQDKVTYQITYSDGQEIKRKELERETVKKPVKKIVAKSTRGMIAGAEYTKKFTVKAYSYTGGGTTAMGTKARVGEIAVDPSVIPLGTKVYVEGYGFARAEDTGGNIKGNTIDVYKSSESACLNWGVRYVTIYILS
ncbi:MAG: DUF348 domain-containing protein [Firmicutes bacterium]|nr:DUF348 domain-containing protein [Bacillota bacterium]